MAKILINVPLALKAKLDALRAQGVSAAGLIRHLLTQYFTKPDQGRKGDKP